MKTKLKSNENLSFDKKNCGNKTSDEKISSVEKLKIMA